MPPIHVVAAALVDAEGRVLLTQRPPGKHLAGYWEFPGGKVEPGESVVSALQRELREEIGVEIGAAEPLIRIPWRYPSKAILLDVYRVHDFRPEPHPREGQALKWVPANALDPHEMPSADHPAITALRLPQLYAITSEPGDDTATLLGRLDAALAHGARLVQFRAKTLSREVIREIAPIAAQRVRRHGGELLLNASSPDDLTLATELGLDGVHLTTSLLRALSTRPLPSPTWVAASCHDADELRIAERLGVDFVVLGPVQPTPSHSEREPLGWKTFESLCANCTVPVYALGGLGPTDVARARMAGAQGIAGISALF